MPIASRKRPRSGAAGGHSRVVSLPPCYGPRVVFLLLTARVFVVDCRQLERRLLSTTARGESDNPDHEYRDSWTFVGYVAAADTLLAYEKEPSPFVDDGMFDPRRDYWNGGSMGRPLFPLNEAGARGLVTTGSADCGTASSSEPCCIECFGLEYCDVLNRYKVEDKYFPSEPTILGSCENFEDRASRLDVFGPAKTFRDTIACREMVYDYTCLWWGSDNDMYDNRCGVEAQVYPCRSYCVQLAKTCANNVVDWIELCRAIDCPPTDEVCVPGPYTQDLDEACYLYEYHAPLNACMRTSSPRIVALSIVAAAAVLLSAAATAL